MRQYLQTLVVAALVVLALSAGAAGDDGLPVGQDFAIPMVVDGKPAEVKTPAAPHPLEVRINEAADLKALDALVVIRKEQPKTTQDELRPVFLRRRAELEKANAA